VEALDIFFDRVNKLRLILLNGSENLNSREWCIELEKKKLDSHALTFQSQSCNDAIILIFHPRDTFIVRIFAETQSSVAPNADVQHIHPPFNLRRPFVGLHAHSIEALHRPHHHGQLLVLLPTFHQAQVPSCSLACAGTTLVRKNWFHITALATFVLLLNLVVPCSACVGGLRDDPLKSILGRYKEGGRR